jgi:chitinase
MPPSTIDFSVVTHVIQFSVVPNSNGSLDSNINSVSASNSSSLVQQAHLAGRKALICVGGAGSQSGFQGASSPANRGTFITNLVNFMSSRGYDGIDIDWEPLDPSDAAQYTNLVKNLRTILNGINPRPLLTAAIASPPTPASLIASMADQFDQINLMTYDLSGPYPGWVTWFNSPIYDGGYRFPSTSGLVPSINGMVNTVAGAGVPRGKLGIGIPFYGYVWSGGGGTSTGGAALPRQTWSSAPSATAVSFNTIISNYYQTSIYHWDTNAQAAWLGIDNTGSANDKFISFDDQRSCQSKISYARNSGLGGIMIWELAHDHQAGQPDPLLQALKQGFATPGATSIQSTAHGVDLSFTTIPLGSYGIQWTSNLVDPLWTSLLITNISGTGGLLHVTDQGGTTQAQRFYRTKTPP